MDLTSLPLVAHVLPSVRLAVLMKHKSPDVPAEALDMTLRS